MTTIKKQTGKILLSEGVFKNYKNLKFRAFIKECLNRYISLDFGNACDIIKVANKNADEYNHRTLGIYNFNPKLIRKNKNNDDKIYIITESDKSITTVLLSSEY